MGSRRRTHHLGCIVSLPHYIKMPADNKALIIYLSILGLVALCYFYLLPILMLGGCQRHSPSTCAWELKRKPRPTGTLLERYGHHAVEPPPAQQQPVGQPNMFCVIPKYLHCPSNNNNNE